MATSKTFGRQTPASGVHFLIIAICSMTVFSGCRSNIPEKPIDDAAITKAVKAKLATVFGPIEDKQIQQLDRGANLETISYISVSSVNGVVTLSGEVRSKRAKAKAGEIARGVAQVERVINNLSLAPGYSDDAVNDKPL
ncbi:MAG: BON domain-containing protein [Bryobacteraceae bacterium]